MAAITAAAAAAAPRRVFTEDDRIFVTIGLYGAFALTVAVPIALMLLWGIADGWSPPDIVPSAFTLDHWRRVGSDAGIFRAALNSLGIAAVVTVLTAAIALPTAWAMARFPFRLKRVVEVFILAPVIVPGLVVAVGIGQVFLALGLAYSVTGVILVQTVGTLPLMIRLMTAALETIPDDLIHAARTLGAGWSGVLRHVILPLAMPGLLAGGLLSFIGSFEEFDKSFIVGAPMVQTLPIKLYVFLDPYALQFPIASTVAFFLLVPALVVFVLAGRIMRDDLMAAGMGKM